MSLYWHFWTYRELLNCVWSGLECLSLSACLLWWVEVPLFRYVHHSSLSLKWQSAPPPPHSVAPVLWPTSNTQFTSEPPYSVWTSTHNTDSHIRPHGACVIGAEPHLRSRLMWCSYTTSYTVSEQITSVRERTLSLTLVKFWSPFTLTAELFRWQSQSNVLTFSQFSALKLKTTLNWGQRRKNHVFWGPNREKHRMN